MRILLLFMTTVMTWLALCLIRPSDASSVRLRTSTLGLFHVVPGLFSIPPLLTLTLLLHLPPLYRYFMLSTLPALRLYLLLLTAIEADVSSASLITRYLANGAAPGPPAPSF